MNEFAQYLFRLRDEALEAAGDKCGRLIRLLEEAENDIADAIADFTVKQSYADWWMTVTDHIEHGGLDPVTALIRVRDAAHNAVLRGPGPHRSMYHHAQSLARTDAARRFYNDTAALDLIAITTSAPTAPAG
ncbi:hypothetical protein [Actinoallomurus rhizosphaericola]|uniref:hypothetical protein n=1 Tax=Actinoallomurus rhizosphaericola TaxID=2952536 RepID=UPI0020936C00|nr:hypothetical protein [Actinoallomurus rhizosphaericola]MCO5999765.1 hypothetical protein [Actinoallomurus rhizosphaericola]